jgi:hypothetical protein
VSLVMAVEGVAVMEATEEARVGTVAMEAAKEVEAAKNRLAAAHWNLRRHKEAVSQCTVAYCACEFGCGIRTPRNQKVAPRASVAVEGVAQHKGRGIDEREHRRASTLLVGELARVDRAARSRAEQKHTPLS